MSKVNKENHWEHKRKTQDDNLAADEAVLGQISKENVLGYHREKKVKTNRLWDKFSFVEI